MGTPDFAVPCLKKLIDSKHVVKAVFTQPDKPVGRKQILTSPPVKKLALENDIDVFQPASLKNDKSVEESLRRINPDVIVVAAYGKILPSEILNIAKHGCINVHASLLPKYRGAAPIQWAVLNGDKETGVTIMQMDEGLDTGDMLLVKKTEIDIDETSEELFNRLSFIGADALLECLDMIAENNISAIKQDEACATFTRKITRDFSLIDWNKTAFQIHNQVRGLQNWPCATTVINSKTFKIHKTKLCNITADKPGIVVDNKDDIKVCCGDGKCIEILEIQAEGKKRMPVKAFLKGNKIEIGTVLGE